MSIFRIFFLVLCCTGSVLSQDKITAIKCGALIDGKSDRVLEHAVIVVEGNTIKNITAAVPSGAEVIDLSNATVLPGLIDCHTHLLLHEGNYDDILLKESLSYRAIRGVVAAKKTLEAGFTTVRDVETEGAMYSDAALRDAINQGYVPGPRMQAATRALSVTGGYAPYGFAPEIDVPYGVQVAGGSDGGRKAVCEKIRYWAEWVQI